MAATDAADEAPISEVGYISAGFGISRLIRRLVIWASVANRFRMPLALIVLVLAAAWRILAAFVPELSNFSPIMALAFCAGVYFRDRRMWVVPVAALVLSDVYLNHFYAVRFHYSWSVTAALFRIACFGAGVGLGVLVSRRRTWLNLFSGALAGSVFFYLVSNSVSWFQDPGYAQTAAGWWQAMTVGHPGFAPTLFFFRNTFVSDLLFTGCFAAAMEFSLLRKSLPSLLDRQRT